MSCLILAPATEEEINSGITDDQRFLQGIYAYANRNASPQMREHANKAFTHIPQYATPKQEAYWMGATACAQFGTYDIKNAYTALSLPIPEGKTSRQLTEELGQYLLSDATSKYQEQDRIIKEKNAKITKHIAGLTNGTLKSSDISLEDSEDIRTATGLSAHDLYAAARIAEIKTRTLSDLDLNNWDKSIAVLKDVSNPFNLIGATGNLFQGNFTDALKAQFPNSTKVFKTKAYQMGNQEKQIAQVLANVENKTGVVNYASRITYDKETQRLANSNGIQKILHTADKTGYSLFRGVKSIASSASESNPIKNTPEERTVLFPELHSAQQVEEAKQKIAEKQQSKLQASAAAASIDSAAAQAESEADTSFAIKGLQLAIEIAPFFNGYTTVASVADMIRQNEGQYYAAVQDKDTGYVNPEYQAEIQAKSAFEGILNWGTRAFPIKYGSKIAQAGLNKLASKASPRVASLIKNPVTTYAAHAGWTASQFAVTVPLEDVIGRATYEATFNSSPELRTAGKNFSDLLDNLKKPDYWLTQAVLGATLGFGGARQHYRANKAIEKEALTKGLNKEEYNKLKYQNQIENLQQASRDAIKEKAKNDPAQLIKDGTENTKQYLSEEQQHAQQELGHSITLDEAKIASLRQNGYDLTIKPDNPDIILVSAGGHIDPDTNKFVPGSKVVEVPRKTAELYFGAIYDYKLRNLTSIIRNAFGKKVLIEDLQKTLTGQVRITRLLNPFSLNKVIETGNKARAARDKKAKQIHEQSKQEDGTHTISIEEATAQADNTIDTTLHKNAPLKDLIRFGENAATRRQQELEKDASIDPDASFMSHAFVLSLGSPLTPKSLTRILHITENASAREVTEEYAEQWLNDYMFQTGTDITDAWRTLQEVNKRVKDHGISLTSINSTHPELADRLNNNLTSDGNITQAELDLIHSDVLEGFSSLILSDLRASIVNADGTMPAWADELYNSSMLTGNLMINELVAAAALAEASTIGKLDEAAKRLLNVTSEQIKSVLNKTKAPTKDTYWDAYQEQKEVYRKLLEESDYHKPEQTDSWLREHAAAAEQFQAELEEKEREQAEPITEAIKELESLPENKDKPREQIVEEVNKRCLDAKKQEILREASVDDPDSSIGKSAVRYVDGGIACRFTTVRVADLTLMPNFKSGADADTGVVSPLVGDYNPAHAPINILRRTDGTLMVISGRHRLAHAKLHGATEIVAYIYDETPQQNLAWARRKDIERNIQDNQATPLDIALLIRGELVEGMQPLSPNEYSIIGIVDKTTGKPRNGSLAELGYNLGTKASTDVINALRNDKISTTAAVAIAISSADPSVQQKGLQAAMDGMSSRDIPTYMSIQQSKIDALKNQGDIFQTDFFGTLQTDTPYSRFVDSYAMKQAKAINAIISGRKKAKQISTSKDAATILDNSGLQIDPNADPATVKANIRADQEKLAKWQSPYLHMDELRDQINKAFAKEHPEEWAKMQERQAEQTQARTDFSVFTSTDHLQEWQLDPTAGLGSLGHFADQITKKFAPIMDDETDKRYARIQAQLKRRQLEIQNMHGKNDIDILLAEISQLPQIVNTLPQRYRFSLEPYIEFLSTYANLIKNADPKRAGKALPMADWDKMMAHSFRKMYNRILNEDMTGLEQMEFAELFSSDIALKDIRRYRDILQKAKETAGLIFDTQHAEELKDPAKAAELVKLREQAIDDAQYKAEQENADIRNTIYKAIGQMRANRLVEKMFARMNLKLEQYRKDRTLAKISRALASITPRKEKNGKPVKGTVSQETYDVAVRAYRLLLLTKSQKEAVEEAYPDLDTMEDNEALTVNTFDENGQDTTLTVTKQEFETYACIEGMTADTAASTAQTLGTLIASGKQAWQIVADQQKQLLNDFCKPIYEANKEDINQKFMREVNEANKIFAGKGVTKGIKRMFAAIYNDAHLIDVIADAPGLQHFRDLQNSIADAHSYLQSADVENGKTLIKTVLSVLGFNDVKDVTKLTGKQRKALGNFFNEVNDIKDLPADGDNAIVLKKQAPDFYKKHSADLRKQLLKHLSTYRRTKNYSPNALAKVLEHLRDKRYLPEDLEKEIFAKYGKEGHSSLYKGDLDSAMNKVFPAERFGHLRNLLATIKERTEASLKKWKEENKDLKPQAITKLTRNVAAYRVLLCEQPDLADALYKQGYTPEVVQQLKNFAGEDMMNLAYAMRDLLGARMPLLKEIYETTYGTPFPVVDNYFRAFFNSSQKETTNNQINELGFGTQTEKGGGMRIFHNRVKHNATIDDTMSVTLAFNIGMREQNNVIAYTDPKTHRHLGEFLNKILHSRNADTTMAQALKAAIGDEHFDALKKQVENTHRIYGHAQAFEAALNRGFRNISGAAAYTMLVYNFGSIMKNGLAAFNTLGGNENIGPIQWAASFGRVSAGQGRISVEQIAKESFIADRYNGWDTDTYLDVIYQQAGIKNYTNKATDIAMRGMSLYGKLDRGACAFSAAIMYDAYHRHLEKTQPDMTSDLMHVESLKAAQKALDLRAQPLNWKQRPLTGSYNSWKSAAFFFLGGESFNALGNVCRLIAKSGFRNPQARKALGNAAAIWAVNGALLSVVNLLLNYMLDDDERWEKRNIFSNLLIGTLSGPLMGMPVASNVISGVATLFDVDHYVPSPTYLPMSDLTSTAKQIRKIFKSDASGWDKAIAASRVLQTIIFFTLLGTTRPTSKAAAITQAGAIIAGAANNAFNFLLRIGEALDTRAFTPVPKRIPQNVRVPKYLRAANKKLKEKNEDDFFGLL